MTDTRTGEAHSLVVVAGPSGSGKTRLVEALIAAKEAIRPYGAMAAGAPWIGAGSAAKVQMTFRLDEAERDFAGVSSATLDGEVIFLPDRANAEADDGLRALLGRYAHNPAYGKVDYFPADRRIPLFPPFPGLGSAEQRILRLGKDSRKYGFVLPFLRTLSQDNAQRERFAASLAALSPSCRYVADPSGDVIPRCFSSHGGDAVTVAQLSHGESDAVIFAATATAIGLDHSLIFVDRPDLHAGDLEKLVTGLVSLGKNNQLFLTGRAEMATAGHNAHVVNLKSA
jgi:predicted ATPase